MYLLSLCIVVSRLRVQRYDFFVKYQMFYYFFLKNLQEKCNFFVFALIVVPIGQFRNHFIVGLFEELHRWCVVWRNVGM